MSSLFIKNFLKNWKEVGSITPSSRFLTRKMLEPIDFAKANIIVELGPGTGVFTKQILSKMKPTARLIVLETNHEFSENLKKINDERFTVIKISAGDLSSVLGGVKADVVVSGIPFSAIKKEVREKMLKQIKINIKKRGKFIQFQYSLDLLRTLNKIFDKEVDVSFVSLNVPPAFVYSCINK